MTQQITSGGFRQPLHQNRYSSNHRQLVNTPSKQLITFSYGLQDHSKNQMHQPSNNLPQQPSNNLPQTARLQTNYSGMTQKVRNYPAYSSPLYSNSQRNPFGLKHQARGQDLKQKYSGYSALSMNDEQLINKPHSRKQDSEGPHALSNDDEKFEQERMKKMYCYPGKPLIGEAHCQANKFGYFQDAKAGNGEVCACCLLPIYGKKQFSIWKSINSTSTGENSMKELDSSAVLFFSFIKIVIMYLLLRFVITDAYNLSTNIIYGNFCNKNEQKCQSIFSQYSSFNRRPSTPQYEVINQNLDFLNLVTVLVSLAYFIYFRKTQYEIYHRVNSSELTQDDFTVMVKNIPVFTSQNSANSLIVDEKQLRKIIIAYLKPWIENALTNPNQIQENSDLIDKDDDEISQNFHNIIGQKKTSLQLHYKMADLIEKSVQQITFCLEINQFQKIDFLREQIMNKEVKMQEQLLHSQSYQSKLKQLDIQKGTHSHQIVGQQNRQRQLFSDITSENMLSQIQKLNKQQINISKQFKQNQQKQNHRFLISHFVGIAFVSFQFQHFKRYLIQKYNQSPKFFKIERNYVSFQQHPRPQDINWFNLKVLESSRYELQVFGGLALGLVLLIALLIMIGLQFATNLSKNSKNSVLKYSTSIALPLATFGVNFFLAYFIDSFTKSERNMTKSHDLISILIKNIIAQTLNEIFLYFILSYIQDQIAKDIFLTETGLAIQISNLIYISGFAGILTNLWFKKSRSYQKDTKSGKLPLFNQFQVKLNKSYQYPKFKYAERYAYYIVKTFTVSFYSYICPVIVPGLIVIFIVQYWVDKYHLFKCSSAHEVSFELAKVAFQCFEVSVLMFACGSSIFAPYITSSNQISICRLLSIIISIVYVVFIFLPIETWKKNCLRPKQKIEERSYLDFLRMFKIKPSYTYCQTNPVTMFKSKRDGRMNNCNEKILANDKFYEEFEKKLSQRQLDQDGNRFCD